MQMKEFSEELAAIEKIYEIVAPHGVGGASRIWSYLSLRLSVEASERERKEREERERVAAAQRPSERRDKGGPRRESN